MGQKIRVPKAGEFNSDLDMRVPRRSALVFQGNSANVAQQCVPSVNGNFITVTLRVLRPEFKRA